MPGGPPPSVLGFSGFGVGVGSGVGVGGSGVGVGAAVVVVAWKRALFPATTGVKNTKTANIPNTIINRVRIKSRLIEKLFTRILAVQHHIAQVFKRGIFTGESIGHLIFEVKS